MKGDTRSTSAASKKATADSNQNADVAEGGSDMSRKPPPRDGFVETLERVPRQGTTRWRNKDGDRFYEWDALHGEFEVYNARGLHLGVVNEQGVLIKEAVKGRRIDV